MKKLLLMKTVFLLCALVAGSSSVWADTEVTINFGTTTGYWSAHTADSYTDSDNRKWSRVCSVSNMSGQASYSQFGNASNTPTVTLTATAGSDMTVTAFSVTMNGASGGSSPTTGTIYLYKKSGETETQLATESVSGTSGVTCSISSNQTFSSTDVLEVKYVGSTKAIRVTELSYSYTTSGGGSSTVSTPSFNNGTGTYTTAQSITLSCATEGATIHYTMTEDGTTPDDPTESDATYSSAISVTKNGTIIKAKAFKSEMTASSVATANYTIKPNGPTFSLDGGSYLQGTTFTLTSAGNTIYYTSDGSTPTTSSTEYTEPVAIAVGSTTYKAISVDTYGNTSNAVTRTYKGITPASLPFSWTGTSSTGKNDLAAKAGVVVNLGGDYANSNAPYKLKFDGTAKYVIIYTNEKPGTVHFTAKLFEAAATGSKMKVQGSVDGSAFTDIEEFTIKGSANDTFEFTTSNAFAANHRVVKLALSYKDKNIAVGTISIDLPGPAAPTTSGDETYLTTSDNMAGWRAFYDASNSYSVDANTKVYVAANDPSAGVITLKKIEGIPADVPVILHTSSSANNYKMTLTKETASPFEYDGTNKLIWATTAQTNVYRLGFGASGVGFYPYSGTPASGAVILNVSSAASARELTIGFDDETTGLKAISNEPISNSQVFDLQGRIVINPTKGLYIVNGKKVVIK